MKLIQTIQALKNSVPGDNSKFLHEQFKAALEKTEFDLELLIEALKEAKFKTEVGLKDAVAECLCIALKESVNSNHDVDSLIQQGKYIEAIKLYRNTYGTGLADSKAAVDLRKAQLGLK